MTQGAKELFLEPGQGRKVSAARVDRLPRDLRLLVVLHDFNPEVLFDFWEVHVLHHPADEWEERKVALIDTLTKYLVNETLLNEAQAAS